jgi:DNA topoisomerase-1
MPRSSTTIQDRGYVRKDKNRLIPEDKGRLVTASCELFPRYVGYDFTAGLEAELDDVSAGDKRLQGGAGAVLARFLAAIDETSELRITEVLEKIDEALEPHLFPPREDGTDPRLCPNCGWAAVLRTARSGGAFIGCSNYPECRFTRPDGPARRRELGAHPEDGAPLQVMEGRYGPYIKWGKVNATLPNEADPKTIDFAAALALVNDKAAKGGKGRRKAPAKRKAPATRKKTATKG